MFKGSIPALITPMRADGSLDYAAWDPLLDFHLAEGTDGIVVGGTTGESPTLDARRTRGTRAGARDRIGERMPVIAGSGTNSTAKSVELSRAMEAAPRTLARRSRRTTTGRRRRVLYRHFTAIADAVGAPVLLYNVPARTACDLLPETVVRLSKHPRIAGIKEATGDLSRAETILFARGFQLLLSGDDPTAAELMRTRRLRRDFGDRQRRAACDARRVRARRSRALRWRPRSINEKLMPLHLAIFVEAEPDPGQMVRGRTRADRARHPSAAHAALSERLHDDVLAAMKAAGVTGRVARHGGGVYASQPRPERWPSGRRRWTGIPVTSSRVYVGSNPTLPPPPTPHHPPLPSRPHVACAVLRAPVLRRRDQVHLALAAIFPAHAARARRCCSCRSGDSAPVRRRRHNA